VGVDVESERIILRSKTVDAIGWSSRGRRGRGGGVPIRVEKGKWRILPVGEVHDQPVALAGDHRRNAPWRRVLSPS
jgi:hypothetical protein